MRVAWQAKIEGNACRMCGGWGVELHHLIPRSKFSKRSKSRRDDPDNAVPLCHLCHQHHHTTAHRRVRRDVLLQEEIEFMNAHIHPGWIDKWYPC